MNELAGQSLGGYLLEEEIGRGSMGVVYRSKQIALGREVAIKVLPQALAQDASYVARFIREAQIIAGLNHPNIVQIYDAGQQNKLLYFVMEYVQGPTLASLLYLDGSIPQYLAAEYAAEIADALDAAYKERHVIHRDIKPENLMLNRWGKVKVMDFGLARAIGLQQITVAKTLVGSIYYASPEQVWGHVLDNRSDVYALGVVLYELVCGQRPFSGRSMPELTQAITRGVLQPPSVHNPEIAPELDAIILTALSRDRDQRYEAAYLMARDLRALNLQPPSPPPLALPGPMPRQQSPNGRIIMQPPKRPQVQQPHYFDIDFDMDMDMDLNSVDAVEPSQFSTNKQMTPPPGGQPSLGLQTHYARRDESPTHQLEPGYRHEERASRIVNASDNVSLASLRKSSTRRSLWHQIQRWFRPH